MNHFTIFRSASQAVWFCAPSNFIILMLRIYLPDLLQQFDLSLRHSLSSYKNADDTLHEKKTACSRNSHVVYLTERVWAGQRKTCRSFHVSIFHNPVCFWEFSMDLAIPIYGLLWVEVGSMFHSLSHWNGSLSLFIFIFFSFSHTHFCLPHHSLICC